MYVAHNLKICTCDLLALYYSMSAPLVAGAAVLVRDYFARGFYPGGREDSGEPAGKRTVYMCLEFNYVQAHFFKIVNEELPVYAIRR